MYIQYCISKSKQRFSLSKEFPLAVLYTDNPNRRDGFYFRARTKKEAKELLHRKCHHLNEVKEYDMHCQEFIPEDSRKKAC